MKKAEAISILATSVRPREAKDRARYDKAVKMAIEALEQPEHTQERTETHACDCISRAEAIELKPEFLNPNVNRETKEQTAIDRAYARGWNSCNTHWIKEIIEDLPSAQPEIIHCKECKYGVQDEDKRWYCRGLGCQVGEADGSGFCADAERRE